jgi:hypothetical protein
MTAGILCPLLRSYATHLKIQFEKTNLGIDIHTIIQQTILRLSIRKISAGVQAHAKIYIAENKGFFFL